MRGSFERIVSLPCAVGIYNTHASFNNSILSIRLPKVANNLRKKIKVNQ